MIRAPAAAVLAVQKPGTKGRFGSRLCENAQEPTTRRIIFSITLLPIAATAPFVFRLTKSGRIFYAKIKRLRFHTASVESRPTSRVPSVRFPSGQNLTFDTHHYGWSV
jgi:hypothetical protein